MKGRKVQRCVILKQSGLLLKIFHCWHVDLTSISTLSKKVPRYLPTIRTLLPIIWLYIDIPPIHQPSPDLCNELLFLSKFFRRSRLSKAFKRNFGHDNSAHIFQIPFSLESLWTTHEIRLAPANSATPLMSELALNWWHQMMRSWRVPSRYTWSWTIDSCPSTPSAWVWWLAVKILTTPIEFITSRFN